MYRVEKDGLWHVAGVFQPFPPTSSSDGVDFQPAVPYDSNSLDYKPLAIKQGKAARFASAWSASQWDEKAALTFFTVDNTTPWDSIPGLNPLELGNRKKTQKGGIRDVPFATRLTPEELMGTQVPTKDSFDAYEDQYQPTGSIEDSEAIDDWDHEMNQIMIEGDQRHSKWVDRLSAHDLEEFSYVPREPRARESRAREPYTREPRARESYTKEPRAREQREPPKQEKAIEQVESLWAPTKQRKPMRTWGSSPNAAESAPAHSPNVTTGRGDFPPTQKLGFEAKQGEHGENRPLKVACPRPPKNPKLSSRFERDPAPHTEPKNPKY